MRWAVALFSIAFLTNAAPAAELLPPVVKVGVLTDMSGPFADQVGAGSVAAARLAVDDFQREGAGFSVEILQADHQNKPDVGLAAARRWLDVDGVSAVVDLPNSAVALAVANLMRERDRVALASSAMPSELTGKSCAPTTVQWVSDTWAQGRGLARSLAAEELKRWYFVAVDYALGAALERDATTALAEAGGEAVGSFRHPLGAGDFSSPLLAATGSGAQVLALANTGADLINAIKQASEFAVAGKMTPAALFIQLSDVHALGLEATQGLRLVTGFYWDRDERTRAFSRRFAAVMNGRMPTEDHAGVYSALLAYLRAVRDARTVAGGEVVAAMRRAPIDDPLFGPTQLRRDGRAVHAMQLYEVKKPGESRYAYDYYRLVATLPGEQAFRPENAGGCALTQPRQ